MSRKAGTGFIGESDVEMLVSMLSETDRRGATSLVLDAYDSGVPFDGVVGDLLAPAQVEVGRRWQQAEWSVAQEHAATAVTDAALAALSHAADRLEPPAFSGVVVLSCAEGEWHSLPARMASESLRRKGFEVTFLGASMPSDEVGRYLSAIRPVAMGISCTVPLHFGSVTRMSEQAHEAGIPVIIGGRALGTDSGRAVRLGADAWASGPVEAAEILRGWSLAPPATLAAAVAVPEALALEARAPEVADAALEVLRTRLPSMAAYDSRKVMRTREDLEYILRFVAATIRCGDGRVMDEFLDWLVAVLEARAVPAAGVLTGIGVLRECLGEDDSAATRLLERGADRLAARVG